MTGGRIYPPEWQDYLDPLTCRQIHQLTDSPAEDHHIYFYNPSATSDGKYLIFLSERARRCFTSNQTGSSNIYLTDWN